MQLSAPATRVVAALVEKCFATPQHYPMTVNALVAACNQKTARDPVTSYTEDDVAAAIEECKQHPIIRRVHTTGARSVKYAQFLDEFFHLDRADVAVLAVLMLRGPQTVGELRQRTDRLHAFTSLDEVHAVLERLATHRFQPLARELPRAPGQKETRWVHLLAGEPDLAAATAGTSDAMSDAGTVTVRLPDDLMDRLRAIEGRTSSEVIEEALRHWLADRDDVPRDGDRS